MPGLLAKKVSTRDAKAALAKLHDYSAGEIARRRIERRAVEAAIWGLPLASTAAMREAFFRDAGARYNDIVYFSKPADWRFQFTTPNASTYYIYFNFNTANGPLVLDLPAAQNAGLFGSFLNAWQEPIVDIGPEGEDHGNGGKYLILPPDDFLGGPAGYIPVHPGTYNGFALFHVMPHTSSPGDVAAALDLVKQMSLCPLAQDEVPPMQRFIDMSGKLFDGIVRFDHSLFDGLAAMIAEEPVRSRDRAVMSQLRSLGIEKSGSYSPDTELRDILDASAAEAHAGLVEGLRGGEPFWHGLQWKRPAEAGPKTEFTFEDGDAYYVDERGLLCSLAFAPPKMSGAATFSLVGASDSEGRALHGEDRYRLNIPAGVPVRQYWSVTVYDCKMAGFVRGAPSISVGSFRNMQMNADGSIDIYFGPTAPQGKEAQWIYTEPGSRWFCLFRFYGPEQALFEQTWTLCDIMEIF